jgi:hypothetical protein
MPPQVCPGKVNAVDQAPLVSGFEPRPCAIEDTVFNMQCNMGLPFQWQVLSMRWERASQHQITLAPADHGGDSGS